LFDGGELDTVDAQRASRFDVGANVVDEDRFIGGDTEVVERVPIDCRVGLGGQQLAGPGQVGEACEPVEVLAHIGEIDLAHIGENGGLHACFLQGKGPFEHGSVQVGPHHGIVMLQCGKALGGEGEAGAFRDCLPVGDAVERAGVVGVTVRPVVLLEDFVGHARGVDERGVRVHIGLHAEHAAEVEDHGARHGNGGGRGGSGHLSIMNAVRFAKRTEWAGEETAWSQALEARRQSGQPVLDLTASNPTVCGFSYDAHLLADLASGGARRYDPDPRGMAEAREAVCGYYAAHDARVDAAQIVLTTSTSEGYSWLFRLLCDPGDEVLIAQPSYPLFDLLATIDDVRLVEYPLLYDPGGSHGWSLDTHTLRQRITPRTRAIVVVHPNNPTGHFTSPGERWMLSALCREHGLALIVDEVFLDYPLAAHEGSEASRTFARGEELPLTFVLSGLSKIAALPQMKASWIVCLGPQEVRSEAMRRLEIIADTFLSMNAPVQHALPGWLRGRQAIQRQVRARVGQNLRMLDEALAAQHAVTRLACEGGWYATLRTPSSETGEALAVRLIEGRGVAVHPGSFFGFAEPNRVVVSLLPEPGLFAEGIAAVIGVT
jgi:alanine-synthesizing transaminase